MDSMALCCKASAPVWDFVAQSRVAPYLTLSGMFNKVNIRIRVNFTILMLAYYRFGRSRYAFRTILQIRRSWTRPS